MVRLRIYILLILLLLATGGLAQEFDAFARVKVSPRDLVVRQPFRVTISVHTATWYTAPLNFANLRIENAFIIPFTRTQSSVVYIQGKQYATLTFYYLVIPYETGTLELPALEISATTPPVGDYKGVQIPLRTQSQRVEVKELPISEEEVWMVAKNVSFRESWNKNLDQLKVGDVVDRTIVLNASGTLPSLIQPLELEKPEGGSLYPAPPELKDTRNAQDVNGRRTEYYSYLFEEEGDIEIPEIVISWWNPVTRRTYQRSIAARTLQIAPNPDLDMMISLKDSLLALQAPTLPLEEKESFPWKKWTIILLVGMVVLYLLYRIVVALVRGMHIRRKVYLASSRYFQNRCRRARRKGDERAFVNALYNWVDHRRKSGQPAAVDAYLELEERKSFIAFLEGVIKGEGSAPQADWKHKMTSILKALDKSI